MMGAGAGLLHRTRTARAEAMQRAYASADLDPASIDYLECHATGTSVGDQVEIRSSSTIFAGKDALPVGSLKSNTGHLITVAGLASVIKLLGAFKHKTLPPTRLDTPANEAFNGSPLYPLTDATPWTGKGPMRAAISNFGFGGNNAHVILEAPDGFKPPKKTARPKAAAKPAPIAICGLGVLAGPDRGADKLVRRALSPPRDRLAICPTIDVDPLFARTPPADLQHTEPAHLALLAAGKDALNGVGETAPERAGVFMAIGCASNSAKWLVRERLAVRFGRSADDTDVKAARAGMADDIVAADVLGAMPNMPANRLNTALDFRGQGFTLSAEASSGEEVLKLALEALRTNELDCALVGGADFATENTRALALNAAYGVETPADMAAALVLKRLPDAEAAGDTVLAVLDPESGADALGQSPACDLLKKLYGTAPIADGLCGLAFDVALNRRGLVAGDEAALPRITTGEATEAPLPFQAMPTANTDPLRPAPNLFWAAAGSKAKLAERVAAGKTGGRGSCRVALVTGKDVDLAAQRASVVEMLRRGEDPSGPDCFYGEGTADGELAFVFTGSAAAYPRMGRGLFMAFPELGARVADTFSDAERLSPLLSQRTLTDYEQLCVVTLLSQAQALLLKDMLGVTPEAAIGLSLGETNSLIAFGIWKQAGRLLHQISADEMYERYLGGAFETAREAWGLSDDAPVRWTNWRVYAPIDEVRQCLANHTHVEINIIYTDEDCVIGGPYDACRAVADALGKGRAAPMNQNLIVHAEAMAPYADTWRSLHTRRTSPAPDVRIYANALNGAYKPSRQKGCRCVDPPGRLHH